MELKNYQRRVLRNLDDFLSLLNSTQSIERAYNECWEHQQVAVGFGGMNPYNNLLPCVPHVCLKVPTGGGKTLLACAALRHIFDGMNITRRRAVVWLVPSNAILEQTLKNLQNPDHDYRRKIDQDFSSRVEVYQGEQALNGQALSPATVEENLSIFVLSYDALRANRKEGRRVYRENGNLAPFVAHYPDPDHLVPNVDDSALIQVLNQLSPVVIVDESHNAQSDLSVEMLRNLNPSFVLDLTATPKKNSNIISIVDARELKRENMVKLPVVIYNRQSQADVLTDAILLRGNLEAQARQEEARGGEYIRPIVLFQAQPKHGENAETFEKSKRRLVDIGVPVEQIAIKTSEINELRGVDLLSRACPIRYIITVNALKEGWDCPFAYILATLANRTSRVDVEQIVGRVLRLPYTRRHSIPQLNYAYVMTSSNDFRETVSEVVKGLNQAGFSDKDYRIGETLPAQQAQPKQISITDNPQPEETDDEWTEVDVARIREALEQAQNTDGGSEHTADAMLREAREQGEKYEAEIARQEAQGTPLTGGDEMRNHYEMNAEFAEDAQGIQLPMFYENVQASLFEGDQVLVSRESLGDGFTLANKDTEISFDFTPSDIAVLDVNNDSRPMQLLLNSRDTQTLAAIIRSTPSDQRKDLCVYHIHQQLNRFYNVIEAGDLKRYISRIVDQMSTDELAQMENALPAYAERIKKKIDSLLHEYRTKQFGDMIETGEITVAPRFRFPAVITPTSTMLPISKQLYTDEGDINDFEHKVISAIAGLDNVRWWHRNLENSGFYLNGPINHYPDFIIRTTRGNIVLVETKGDHLYNSDSKAKLALGRKWQELCGGNYRYFMVFDNNDTGMDGAYRLDEFMGIMKRL